MTSPGQFGILLLLTINALCGLNGLQQNHEAVHENSLLPKSFSECIDAIVHPSLPKYLLPTVQNLCLDGFISVDHTHKWTQNFTLDEQNYIRSIFRKVISDASRHASVHSRGKRSVNMIPRRVRREVRDTPYSHWQQFARNVRRLKFEVISPLGRSKYDIIADIHGTVVNNAHFGPNFLPWHRIYLIVFEAALGVPIPFWDSSICNAMDDPTQSSVWTDKYFGNGFGLVRTGPFANFQTPVGPLYRNIGSDGSLFNRREIDVIFTKFRLRQISEPTAEERASLEGQHNGVHVWVDGQMNDLTLAPHDPCFYLHHCFIDYLWEIFRSIQYQRGIDPTKDTIEPPENVTLQNFTQPAVGLIGYYNSDGYSKMLAAMVKYTDSPKCPFCSNSPDLYCDKSQDACIGRIRNPEKYRGNPKEAIMGSRMAQMMTGGNMEPFSLYNRDSRVRTDSVTMNYTEMNIMNTGNSDALVNNIVINATDGKQLNMEIRIKIDNNYQGGKTKNDHGMGNNARSVNGMSPNSQSLANDMSRNGQSFAYGMSPVSQSLPNAISLNAQTFTYGVSQNRQLIPNDMSQSGQSFTNGMSRNYKSFSNDMSRTDHSSWDSQPLYKYDRSSFRSMSDNAVFEPRMSGGEHRNIHENNIPKMVVANYDQLLNLRSNSNNRPVMPPTHDMSHAHNVVVELKPGPVEYRDRAVAMDMLSYGNIGSSMNRQQRNNVPNNYVSHGGRMNYDRNPTGYWEGF